RRRDQAGREFAAGRARQTAGSGTAVPEFRAPATAPATSSTITRREFTTPTAGTARPVASSRPSQTQQEFGAP
ncbi:MAG: hypothetical protein JWM31_2110, partial [Solirubrobacterales bacterium]|nr:hypothetical protein [Solirubrobacterales bacterium]